MTKHARKNTTAAGGAVGLFQGATKRKHPRLFLPKYLPVFFAHKMEDLTDRHRHIDLSLKDLKLLNPNSRTCPIFRTDHDANLTKRVYGNVPVLVDKSRKSGGNPRYRLQGNRWSKGKSTYLPLYEAKMIQAYDHRAAGVRIETENWMRQGQTEESSLVEHQNPEFVVQPRYWVDSEPWRLEVEGRRTRPTPRRTRRRLFPPLSTHPA